MAIYYNNQLRNYYFGSTGSLGAMYYGNVEVNSGQTSTPTPSWSPADFTNLWDWWSSGTGVALSGTDVTSWTGYNGNILNPYQSSYYPLYNSSDSDFNNEPSITMNRNLDNVDAGMIINLPSNQTSKTLFLIGKLVEKNTTTENPLLSMGPSVHPRTGIWGMPNSTDYLVYYSKGTGDNLFYGGSSYVNGTYQFVRMTFNRTTGIETFYASNTSANLDTPIYTITGDAGVNFTNGVFGAASYYGQYGRTSKIKVVEVIFINGIPTSGEISSFQTYLSNTYGI
jgi:hypothetical protein